jgi:hypothetical protein
MQQIRNLFIGGRNPNGVGFDHNDIAGIVDWL